MLPAGAYFRRQIDVKGDLAPMAADSVRQRTEEMA
jgi:hypothetical protein